VKRGVMSDTPSGAPFCEFRHDGSLVICNYGPHGEQQELYIRPSEIDKILSWLKAAQSKADVPRETSLPIRPSQPKRVVG